MTDSSCRAGGRFRPFARLNQPFLGATTSPPWPGSRHVFTSSTCSRLLLANRNRISSLGSARANRYSVRRDRFDASVSHMPPVDFCNTHRRADTPIRAFNPRPKERPRSLGSFHHRHADDGDKPTPRSAFACATWAGSARAKGSRSELPSSKRHPSTRVAEPLRNVGWRLPHCAVTRPRSASAAAPRRATVSDESRCFPPNWNPCEQLGLSVRIALALVGPPPSHAAPHFRDEWGIAPESRAFVSAPAGASP